MVFLPLVCDHRCSFNPAKRLRRRPLAEALLLVLGAGPLSAATIAVNSTADGTLATLVGNGTCDLREAIAAASTNSPVGSCPGDGAGLDTINLAGIAGQTITLTTGQLTINSDITIQGDGATIDGNNNDRVFYVVNNATATLNSLTIQNGYTNFSTSGGVYARFATVVLTNSTISGNTSGSGSGAGLGARGATVVLANSTVSGNVAGNSGGGVVVVQTTVNLTNSTISGNIAGNSGGGVQVSFSTINLTNSTVSGNTAGNSGGGISGSTNATINLTNSIVANNTASFSGPIPRQNDLAGSPSFGDVANVSFSLIGTDVSSGGIINQGAGSQVGSPGPIDPLLGPLQNNGGPTETHALLLGSPAIDTGSNALALDPGGSPLSTDQRSIGFPRIFDGDEDATATVDLGAVEFPTLQNVNTPMGAMLSNQSLSMTPAPEAPAGTFGFDVNFCNTAVGPGNNLSLLFSRTITLSNSNNLVSRSRDGTPPGGAGSEQDFVVPGSGDYADGVLSPSECVVVNYQIGLSTLQQFAFIIDVIGSVQ